MPHTDGMTGKTRQLIKKIIYLAGIIIGILNTKPFKKAK